MLSFFDKVNTSFYLLKLNDLITSLPLLLFFVGFFISLWENLEDNEGDFIDYYEDDEKCY